MILIKCDACGKKCAISQMRRIEFKYCGTFHFIVYDKCDVCIECATDLNNFVEKLKETK